MIKTISKKSILVFLSLLFFLTITLFCLFGKTNKKVDLVYAIPDDTIASEYILGQEVDIPEEIEVEFNGKKYTAKDGVIKFPDASIVNCGKLTLDQEGIYTVLYCFNIDGFTYSTTKEFVVSKNLCYLGNENGSISAVTQADQVGKTYSNSADNVTQTKDDALIVRLADKNTFYYTKSIDLKNEGDDGLCDIITLDYNLSNFAINEKYVEGESAKWKKYKQTSESATYCIVRLTDSYDDTVYVNLVFHFDGPVEGINNVFTTNYDVNEVTWPAYKGVFTANAVGQKRTGAIPWRSDLSEWGGFKKATVNGSEYGFYIDNRLGLDSYVVLGQTVTMDHLPYTWKYDYETNDVYLQVGDKIALVSSLSNSNLYGNDTFSGFESGKVRLSIYMSEYITDKEGRIDIFDIADSTGDDLLQGVKNSGYRDDVAKPEISIDTEKTDYSGIYAPLHSLYTLPVPTIIGGNKSNGYSVYTYINYNTDIQIDVPIINGAISIDSFNQYTIVYKAKNDIGVESEYILNVNPVDVVAPISVNADFSSLSEVPAGKAVTLPEYSVSTINRSDRINVVVKAVSDNHVEVIDKNTMTFIPKYVGLYKIIFECSDNVYSVSKEFTVNCVTSDYVGFLDELVLPKYLIKGASYSLPEISGYEFSSSEPKRVDTKVYVKFDDGDYVSVADIRKVNITGSSTAKFKYEVSKNGNTDILESEDIEIVDVNFSNPKELIMKNYFKHDGFTVVPFDQETNPKTDLKYDVNAKSGNYSLKFINTVDINNLDLRFKLLNGLSNYGKFNIKLVDYYDESICFNIQLFNNSSYCIVNLNGERDYKTSYLFEDDSVTKKIGYDPILKKLYLNDIEVVCDLSSVFTSDYCYIEYELIDVFASSSVIIDTVCNQTFRQRPSNNSDKTDPLISFVDFSGDYTIGQKVNISVPCVSDVLSPMLKGSTSIYVSKDDRVLRSLDGIKLDESCDPFVSYQIELNEVGTYSVVYKTIDEFGNGYSKTVFLNVVDSVAPTIEFVKGYENNQMLKCNVGDKIDFSTKIADDICSEEEIFSSTFIKFCSSNAIYGFYKDIYVFDRSGEYEFFVIANDLTGNSTYSKITIIVE